MTSDRGLIGDWSPGIGDPSVMGWVTVAVYFFTAYRCFRLAPGRDTKLVPYESHVWWSFVVILVALGINKQLDLQTALTEIDRILAREEGWYGERRIVQAAFLGSVAAISIVGIANVVWLTRKLPIATRVAVVGGVGVVTFVVVRAASFHHVDVLIGHRLFGLKVNWVLEIGSISMILIATYFRSFGASWGPTDNAAREIHDHFTSKDS
jgi:hypothetical protein